MCSVGFVARLLEVVAKTHLEVGTIAAAVAAKTDVVDYKKK